MPSWQARLMNVTVRVLIRRRDWGPDQALARRARRVFGAPPIYRSLIAMGLRRTRVRTTEFQGESLTPPAPQAGAVLYVHGGGFVACTSATHRPITAALARRTNRQIFSLDYRLAPEHRYPAAIEDVMRAYAWICSETHGAPLALAGDSAGGNLVLGAAIRLRDRGEPPPACLVVFSPWTDLAATGPSSQSNDGVDPMFRRGNAGAFATTYLASTPADDPEVSPVYAELGGLPPTLFHVGTTELLLDDARRVHERIRAAGGRSELRTFEGVAHGWQMLAPWVPEARASLREAAEFIVSHLSG